MTCTVPYNYNYSQYLWKIHSSFSYTCSHCCGYSLISLCNKAVLDSAGHVKMFLLHLPPWSLALFISDCSLFLLVLFHCCFVPHLLVIVGSLSCSWSVYHSCSSAYLLFPVYFSFSFIVVLCSLCRFTQSHMLVVVFVQLLPFSALAIYLSFTALSFCSCELLAVSD